MKVTIVSIITEANEQFKITTNVEQKQFSVTGSYNTLLLVKNLKAVFILKYSAYAIRVTWNTLTIYSLQRGVRPVHTIRGVLGMALN